MSNSVVRAAFETRLYTWAQAQSPVLPIAFESRGFTRPSAGIWLEAILIPNVTMNRDVAATKQTALGIFQINCWAPQGVGMGDVTQVAEAIAALFPVVPKTGSVSIESPPHVGRGMDSEDGWDIVPVTIMYRYES